MPQHVTSRPSGGVVAYSLGRVFRRKVLVALVAPAVVLAIVATMVQQTTSFAAPAVGGIQWTAAAPVYAVDATGCHASMPVLLHTQDEALAATVKDVLLANAIKSDLGADSPVKMVQVNDVGQTSSTVQLTLDAWETDAACTSTQAATRSSPSDPAVAAAAVSWQTIGWVTLAAAAVFGTIMVFATGGITLALALAGITMNLARAAALKAVAGCLAGTAAAAVIPALLGTDINWKMRLVTLATGCVTGGLVGVASPLGSVLMYGQSAGNALRAALPGPDAVVGAAAAGSRPGGIQLSVIPETIDAAAEGAIAAA